MLWIFTTYRSKYKTFLGRRGKYETLTIKIVVKWLPKLVHELQIYNFLASVAWYKWTGLKNNFFIQTLYCCFFPVCPPDKHAVAWCSYYRNNGYCNSNANRNWMRVNCAQTCGYCSTSTGSETFYSYLLYNSCTRAVCRSVISEGGRRPRPRPFTRQVEFVWLVSYLNHVTRRVLRAIARALIWGLQGRIQHFGREVC